MTPRPTSRLDTEGQLIRQAIARLLAGRPQRSDGNLTVTTLAIEAGLPRHRLYEHHPDLLASFKTRAGTGPISPDITALRRQLLDAHDRIRQLETINSQLQRKITVLGAVIVELTHEAHEGNVVPLLPRRHPSRAQS